jgi:hypothetical protein
MRKYFDYCKKSLLAFIDQRDFLMKAYLCPPSEAALLSKLLWDHQQSSPNDLFFLFPEPFANGRDYVDAICDRLQREYEAARDTPGDEFEKLPELPPVCSQPTRATPTERFLACLKYGRSLVPAELGHRVVWCFSPETIEQLDAYLDLWNSCLPHNGIETWMRGSRIVVRLPPNVSREHRLFQGPRFQWEEFIIPENAAEEELRANQHNNKLAISERMQSQLQLAFIDLAHGRLPQAKEALLGNLAYYQQRQDFGLQALAMIGLGDISRREKDIEKAKYWYECAIRPSGEGKQIMCLSLCADHLGEISFTQKRWQDAEFYYDQLAILKRSMPDESGLVDALLWRSRAQLAAGQSEPATAGCQEALLLCKTFELEHKETECLNELRRALKEIETPERVDALCKEWRGSE